MLKKIKFPSCVPSNLSVLYLNDVLDKSGFVSYKVETNSPPVNGTCDFTPRNGSAINTKFTFTCQNWKDDSDDPKAILFYKVLYFSVEEQQDFLLYHGPEKSVKGLTLPAGPEKYNHTFNLTINVEDAFKSFSSRHFTVKVSVQAYMPDSRIP
jgi:hypothetical protein